MYCRVSLKPTKLFACLSDCTRLRLLALLSGDDALCVCELVHALADIQPKVSRHLASLRECGLVTDDREGTRVYYRLAPELPPWAERVVRLAASAIAEEAAYRDDRARLAAMPNRPIRNQLASRVAATD
ncbi:MAG: metalloregulator ArsR/SmtB family transcription factor [Gammaproteobacteria bacterium]|nr:metalloregulator ArsR/SmtB family transcription factor [Gammaproteobacteria bacterium]